MADTQNYIVIGAGPVGLAVALQLNLLKINVTVYEGRDEIPNDPEQSYPIGINPRAVHTFENIDKKLAEKAVETGVIIDAWQIFAGKMMVADLKSGSVYGTTRGGVNTLLYEKAVERGIKIVFGHRISAVDMATKTLTFTKSGSVTPVVVDASKSRVIAGDGVNSIIRKSMEGVDGFKSVSYPWTREFRVLFSSLCHESCGDNNDLDAGIHYIYNGSYTAAIRKDDGSLRWTCVVGTDGLTPPKYKAALTSNTASTKNIALLREFLEMNVAPMASSFTDNDLKAYFTKRSFRGAVVEVNKLNHGEWLLLMGDAAHSVLPATGEGINSGLEDTSVFYELLKAKMEGSGDLSNVFQEYNAARFPDTAALTQLAKYLNETAETQSSFENASRLGFRIVESTLKKRGTYPHTHEDYCFGPEARERVPYRVPLGEWMRRKAVLLPRVRVVFYPMVLLYKIIKVPFQVIYYVLASPYYLYSAVAACCSKPESDELKSPLITTTSADTKISTA